MNIVKKTFLLIALVFLSAAGFAVTYTESFDNNTYMDSTNTTANWNIFQGLVQLNQSWQAFGGDANISQTSTKSLWPHMVLDGNGFPVVVWPELDTPDGNNVYLLRWNGSNWVDYKGNSSKTDINVTGDVGNAIGSPLRYSVALDSNGHPHVAFLYFSNADGDREVGYIKWNGSNWVDVNGNVASPSDRNTFTNDVNVSRQSGFSQGVSLKVDANGFPHIAWSQFDETNRKWKVHYQEWDGTYWTTLGDLNITGLDGNAADPSLDLNSDAIYGQALPSIAYVFDNSTSFGNGREIYYKSWNGTAWVDANGQTGDTPDLNVSQTPNQFSRWPHFISLTG